MCRPEKMIMVCIPRGGCLLPCARSLVHTHSLTPSPERKTSLGLGGGWSSQCKAAATDPQVIAPPPPQASPDIRSEEASSQEADHLQDPGAEHSLPGPQPGDPRALQVSSAARSRFGPGDGMCGNLLELWGGGLGAAVAPLGASAVVSEGRLRLPVVYLPESQLCFPERGAERSRKGSLLPISSPLGLADVSTAQGPPLV